MRQFKYFALFSLLLLGSACGTENKLTETEVVQARSCSWAFENRDVSADMYMFDDGVALLSCYEERDGVERSGNRLDRCTFSVKGVRETLTFTSYNAKDEKFTLKESENCVELNLADINQELISTLRSSAYCARYGCL